MVTEGKESARRLRIGFFVWSILDVLLAIASATIAYTVIPGRLTLKEYKKQAEKYEDPFVADHELNLVDQKNYLYRIYWLAVAVCFLVIACLRCFAIVKLGQSLGKEETKPQEAMNSLGLCRTINLTICVIYIYAAFPLAILNRFLMDYCLNSYQTALRNEINPRQMMMDMGGGMPMMVSPSGNPMMMIVPSSGNGQGPPWQVSSNVVYPTPAYNVPNNENVPQTF